MPHCSPVRSGRLRPFAFVLLAAATCNNAPPPQSAKPAETPAGLRIAYITAMQREAGPSYGFVRGADFLSAENPAQAIRPSVSGSGLRIDPAAATATDDRRLELALAGFVCAGSVSPIAAGTSHLQDNRLEYVHPAITEWYVNGPLGVEQGFTVASRPSCAAPGELELSVNVGDGVVPTLRGSGDGQSSQVELSDRSGKPWLRYSDLYAFDADGRSLAAQLAVVDGRIHLRIDDSTARYPIAIDPLVWTVTQQIVGSDTTNDDFFGRSLALSTDTAIIGAFNASLTGKPNAGAAYVFVRSGTAWSQQQKLTAPDAAQDAAFGYAVAIAGDSVIVGAPGATESGKSEVGSAYVYTRSGTTWSLQQQLAAADGSDGDQFGDSVAIEGDTAVVGADYALGGAAYVFVRSGTTWSQQQKLTGSDSVDGDHFAQAITLSSNSIAAGAPYADLSGKTSAGAAYVFLRAGTTWTEQAKLVASDAAAGDGFGSSISLATDSLFIGSPSADLTGKVDAGAAYFFSRSGTTWTQKQKLTATSAAASDAFGQAIAQSGANVLIGADGTSGGGAAYIFALASTYTQQQLLTSPFIGADGNFGRGVALGTDIGFVGAPYSTLGTKTNSGVVLALALGMTKPKGQICASAVECASGFCVDGVCCESVCGGGAADCQACSMAAGSTADGTCATAKSGSTCRAAAGPCDNAESCDGASTVCPTDSFKAGTTQCRGAVGLCDVAEYCTGSAAACPSDSLKPADSECRASIGACDIAEKCSGLSVDCPSDSYKPNTSVCRPAAGLCDLDDFCTGSGASCPTDAFKASATPCRAAAGLCDAPESCTGMAADCPVDTMAKAGTECRAAVGPCDAAETCSGTSIDCPADAVKPNTAECRPANGLCDSAEFCSGSTIDCPADKFKPATAVCRPTAGACDVSEYCSGGSPACPTDILLPAAVPCRAAASACDVAESCTGTDAACPEDHFQGDGMACTGGSCQTGACRQEADLQVKLAASSFITSEQQPVDLKLTVSNLGQAAASVVHASLDVPPGAQIMNGGGQGWNCQTTDTNMTCDLSALANGAQSDISASVVPPKGQAMFTLVATTSANEFDPNQSNNSDTLEIQNSSPTKDGGCAMTPGRTPPASGYAGAALFMLLAAALKRGRRRVR